MTNEEMMFEEYGLKNRTIQDKIENEVNSHWLHLDAIKIFNLIHNTAKYERLNSEDVVVLLQNVKTFNQTDNDVGFFITRIATLVCRICGNFLHFCDDDEEVWSRNRIMTQEDIYQIAWKILENCQRY